MGYCLEINFETSHAKMMNTNTGKIELYDVQGKSIALPEKDTVIKSFKKLIGL